MSGKLKIDFSNLDPEKVQKIINDEVEKRVAIIEQKLKKKYNDMCSSEAKKIMIEKVTDVMINPNLTDQEKERILSFLNKK